MLMHKSENPSGQCPVVSRKSNSTLGRIRRTIFSHQTQENNTLVIHVNHWLGHSRNIDAGTCMQSTPETEHDKLEILKQVHNYNEQHR